MKTDIEPGCWVECIDKRWTEYGNRYLVTALGDGGGKCKFCAQDYFIEFAGGIDGYDGTCPCGFRRIYPDAEPDTVADKEVATNEH